MGACSNWANDYDADAKKNGITDGIVTLSNPRHIDITADRAYVVVPANYTFKKKGKLVKEIGSMFTFALQKGFVTTDVSVLRTWNGWWPTRLRPLDASTTP